ncbi:hypothetical protein PQG02_08350 [Nostoc sp. UHCC 0926]|nr:hypothetical protein PQG02_08350 [Nostoc sp. UHCC 0926]
MKRRAGLHLIPILGLQTVTTLIEQIFHKFSLKVLNLWQDAWC